jgi:spermidine synthase
MSNIKNKSQFLVIILFPINHVINQSKNQAMNTFLSAKLILATTICAVAYYLWCREELQSASTREPLGQASTDICVNADTEDGDCLLLRNVVTLYNKKSQYQHIEVVETQSLGRCLLLDRVIQFCDSDEKIYTQEIVDSTIQLISYPTNLNILVIGGGDGLVANYLLEKYEKIIKSITLVELDSTVSTTTQQFFTQIGKYNSFSDTRVKWIYNDAAVYVASKIDEFIDLVIIDCTDPTESISQVLYTTEFYRNLYTKLKRGGLIVQQMNIDHPLHNKSRDLAKMNWGEIGFENITTWKKYVPSYGGEIVFMRGKIW